MVDSPRRKFLQIAGSTTVVGLAGCSGNGDSGGTGGSGTDTKTIDGSEYPAIDEWLTETEIGGAVGNYGGALLDWTGRDTVTVEVGVESDNGNFAYGPPAVVVSTGTRVEFSWTGKGSPHNVEARPEEQLGKSDYTFGSGEPEGGSGVKYTLTTDTSGIALYHCDPHLSLGMKGGIAVE